jgi:PKD repeat protein
MMLRIIPLFTSIILLLAGAVHAQTFRPDHLPGLRLWLRADSNVVVSGSSVSDWKDCSGNSFHAVQTAANLRPVLTSGLPEINNKPALHFDGSNDLLNGVSIPNIHDSSFSIFILAQNEPNINSRTMFAIGTYATGLTLGKQSNGRFIHYQNNSFYNSVNANDCSNDGTPFRVYTATKQLGVAARVYVNSSLRNSSTNAALINTFTNNNYTVGFDNFVMTYWRGRIAEIIVFETLLPANERQAVEQYLIKKYSPPLNLGPDIHVQYGFCPVALHAGNGFEGYLWSTGETTSGITVTKTGSYSVSATDIFGFQHTDTVFVSFPSGNLNVNDTMICAGNSLTIFPVIDVGNYSFLWSDASIDTLVTVAQSGEFWVRITDTAGCFIYSDTVAVAVDSFAYHASLGPDTSFCAGNMLLFDHPGYSVQSYQWSTGSTDSTIMINSTGSYWLTAIDQQGCIATDTIWINITGDAPVVLFEADTVCLGDTTFFADLSYAIAPDFIVGRTWSFGDGDSSSMESPAHVYATAGVYTVSLLITANSGCFGIYSKTVVVKPVPLAMFSATAGCFNMPLFFYDESSPPSGETIISWFWDFGDGNNSIVQHPQHVYAAGGNYQVSLTVMTENGCPATVSLPLQVLSSAPLPGPITLISPGHGHIAGQPQVTFSWNPGQHAVKYALQLSDDEYFSAGVVTYNNILTNTYTAMIQPSTRFWRVIGYNLCNDSVFSPVRTISHFYPALLPDMELWLRADSNVMLSGNAVAQWNDCSGNDFHAVQGTANWRPLWSANLPEINHMPALHFDGSNDLLSGSTIPNIQNTSFSAFIVAQNDPGTNSRTMLSVGTYANGLTLGKQSNGRFIHYQNNAFYNSINPDDCSNDGTPFRIYTATKELGVMAQIFVNSAFRNSSVNPDLINAFTNNNYTVGYDNFVMTYWRGKIAEVILFSDVLADTNRLLIEKYLRYKYAPPVNLGPDIHIAYGFCDTILDAGARFVSYLWSTGDTTQTITINQGGMYWVSVTDIFGFPSSDTILVNKPILALHDTTVCVFSAATLHTGLGAGYSFLWSDGSTGADLLTDIGGVYWVTVFDSLGCSITDTALITVDSLAVKAGLGPDRSACRGELLMLAFGAQYVAVYEWSDHTGNAAMLIQAAPGTYEQYSVTLTSSNGCIKTDSVIVFIKGEAPSPHFTSDSVCAGSATQFTDLSIPSPPEMITVWLWDFGDGSTSADQDPLHVFGNPGLQNVSLTVTTDSGCFKTITLPVAVWAFPHVHFSPVNGCSGVPIQFIDLSDNVFGTNNFWLWDFGLPGHTDTSSLQNPVFLFDSAGTFTVTLVVGSTGGCKDTLTTVIHIRLSLLPDFSASHSCYGEHTNFHDLTYSPPWNPIWKWSWDFGDGDTSSLANPSHEYPAPGLYTVTMTIYPLNGCKTSLQKTIEIYPRPVAEFFSQDLCVGQAGQIFDSSYVAGDVIDQWWWEFPDGVYSNQQHPVFVAGDTGTMYVTLIVTTANACSDTVSGLLTVHPLPEVSFTLSPEFGPAPLVVDFVFTGTGASAWLWDFGDGNYSTLENPQHTFLDNNFYSVTLTAYSPFGCFDTAAMPVYVMHLGADIQVKRAYATRAGNQLILSAELLNLGMRPVSELFLHAQYSGGIVITETWQGNLGPGEVLYYDFNARFQIPSGYSVDYACVSAEIPGYHPDDNPDNNEHCAVLNNSFYVSEVYPNPCQGDIHMDIIIPFEGEMSVDLFDSKGRKVAGMYSGSTPRGVTRLKFDASVYRQGLYAIRVQFLDKKEVRKFVKTF